VIVLSLLSATTTIISCVPYIVLVVACLFHEFGFASLEFLLASHTAKMIGFPLIGDFVFGCVFVKDHAANWVSVHFLLS